MNKMLWTAVFVAAAWAGVAAEYDPHAGRRLVWSDEFNGTDLDVTKWNFRQTMTTEGAVYDNGPETVRVEDGVLKLMVGRSGKASKPWLLPQGLTTADGMAFKYGYVEMRARLPFRDGAWPSFWTQTTDQLRTAGYMAEVDILEAASTNSLSCVLHKWWLGSPRKHDKTAGGSYHFENIDNLPNEFHVYGFEWSPTEVSFYVDGTKYATRAIDDAHDFGTELPGMDGFRDYMYLILNNEIFTESSSAVKHDGVKPLPDDTPVPVNYWVDWIRLYQNPSCEYLCAKTAEGLAVQHSPLEALTNGVNPAVDSQGATWTVSRRERANDPLASGAVMNKRVQTSRKVGFGSNDSSGVEVFAVCGDGSYAEGDCVFEPGEIVFKPTARGYGNWRVALTFELPHSGWYAMSARFRAADTNAAGKVDTSVLLDGQVLQQEELVRTADGQPCRGHACAFAHKFLPKGTTIEFVVGPCWDDSTSEMWWTGHDHDATALTLSLVEENRIEEMRLSVADLGSAIGGLTEQTAGSAGTFADGSASGIWSLCQFARGESVTNELVRIPLSRVSTNDVGTAGVVFRSSATEADDPQVKINGATRAKELGVTERKWACPYDVVTLGEVLVNPSDGQCLGVRFVPAQAGGYVVSVKARDLAMSQDTTGSWGHSGVDVSLFVNGKGMASSRVSAEVQAESGCYSWFFAQTDVLPLQGGATVDLVIDPRDSSARDFTGLAVQVFRVSSSTVGLPTAYAVLVDVPRSETNRIDATFAGGLGTLDLVKNGRGVLWSSSALADYPGNITVAEGALMVSENNSLGTTVGTTDVRPGATLIINTGSGVAGCAANDALALSESIYVGGTGDSQWGAAIYQPASGYSQQKAFSGSVFLTEDATFSMGTRAGFTGGELYMRGHTLTLCGSGTFNLQRSRITPRASSDVGDIVVENGTFQIGGSVSGQFGDSASTVTVKNGATLTLWESYQLPVWTLVVEEGGKVGANGGNSIQDWTAINRWGGEVVWNSTVSSSVIARNEAVLTFKESVTGTGAIRADRGTIVFEKPCDDRVGVDIGNARVVMPSADNFPWGHGGMKIGYRADGSYGTFGPERSDVTWTYCAEGPGPQLGLVNWPLHNPETYRSCGYIWNREATNVTYTVFIGVPYQNYMYLDGVNVYNNKRDNWGGTYTMILTPGPHALDIATVAYGTNGPRSDNDKPKMNGVIMQDPGNGYLFTTDAVSRVEILIENAAKAANCTFGTGSVLDGNGAAVELTDLSGFVTITNAVNCKVKGAWTVKAADIGVRRLVTTDDCPLTFENVTIAMTPADVDAIPLTQRHWDLCSAASYSGFTPGQILTGNRRLWKVVVDANGKPGLDYVPKRMVMIFR